MDLLKILVDEIAHGDGTLFLVGGAVRDELLGIQNKDLDVESFGLSENDLEKCLLNFIRRHSLRLSSVGKSFRVFKISDVNGNELDISLPRLDHKIGVGHKGFEVTADPLLSFEKAASRRDFTINAIMKNLHTNELVDPFNGKADLENRILRATSEHFAEDPLRVLRGFQFVSRFGLKAEERTLEMCRTLKDEFSTLAKERIWAEWEKWALKCETPSLGLKFLVDSHWIDHFPELKNLIDVPQHFQYHPEGCVFVHTLHVCDAAAMIANREGLKGEDRVTIVLAALCHDLGKAVTTEFTDGQWRSPGHAEAGVPLSQSFLKRIGCLDRIIERVLPLVSEHMAAVIPAKEMTDRMVRRLCSRLGAATLPELMMIFEADFSGRPPLAKGLNDGAKRIWEIAGRLSLKGEKPKGIIGGKHLLAKGLKPGPQFGLIIKRCFEAQLDGAFHDEKGAVAFLEDLTTGSGL